MQQFQQRKQQEIQALTGQLQQLQSSIDSTQQLMSAALSGQADAASQALSDAQSSQAAAAAEMGQTLQSAGAAVAGALDSLRESLQAQSAGLQAFSQQQQEATKAAQEAAAAGLARAKDAVSSVGTSVQQLHGVAQNTAEAVDSKLASFAAEFESSMAQKQQALVAQLGSLLAGFVQDRQDAVAAAVADMKQQLAAGQRELSGAASGAAAAVDGCMSKLKVCAHALENCAQAGASFDCLTANQAAGPSMSRFSRLNLNLCVFVRVHAPPCCVHLTMLAGC